MNGRACLIGFDSAWTDNPKQPGAICAAVFQDGRRVTEHEPRLATFAEAAEFVARVSAEAGYLLVALDQPTIVPNATGMRPAEKVAGAIVNGRGGGVQPGNRSRTEMFGDDAPIWRFLAALGARQNPPEARAAAHGRFLIEVFPALTLHAWMGGPQRAAKYNPANAGKFVAADWVKVCAMAATRAASAKLTQMSAWAAGQAANANPRKGDQDRLDSLLCLLIAIDWRNPACAALCIGDAASGCIVTPATAEMCAILTASAAQRGVPINGDWPDDADHASVVGMPLTPSNPRAARSKPRPLLAQPTAGARTSPTKIAFEPKALRTLLIGYAEARRTVGYGDVAEHFGVAWSQGAGTALATALTALGAENVKRDEPLLMTLVVSKSSGLPGAGFFAAVRTPAHNQRAAFERHRDAVFAHRWR